MTGKTLTAQFFEKPGVLTRMPRRRREHLVGEIVFLMLQSQLHRGYRINDIGSVVLPPIHLNQFRTYRVRGQLVGFVTWARLTERVEQNYLTGSYHLRPQDWDGGARLWFVDFIAPFGHAREMVRDLRTNIHPEETGYSVHLAPDGKIKGVRFWRGVRAAAERRQ